MAQARNGSWRCSDLPESSFAAEGHKWRCAARVSACEGWKFPGCATASIMHRNAMRRRERQHWTLKPALTTMFGHPRYQPSPFSACCDLVRVIGDLRLDPVTIE
jgi:hypothetical protein